MLGENEAVSPDEMHRNAYLQVNEDNPWNNNQAYLNTLDPASVKRFLEVTRDRYAITSSGATNLRAIGRRRLA